MRHLPRLAPSAGLRGLHLAFRPAPKPLPSMRLAMGTSWAALSSLPKPSAAFGPMPCRRDLRLAVGGPDCKIQIPTTGRLVQCLGHLDDEHPLGR